MKRIWIDTDIGTNPDDATALYFAIKHPELDVAGISISGSQQEKRKVEAQSLFAELSTDIPIYLGDEITAQIINGNEIQHTVAIGPMTNIAKLILDEAELGKIHIMAGCFSSVYYRGRNISIETNAIADQDATRIVLTQHEQISISSLDATAGLILEGHFRDKIENESSYLKGRYKGYEQHLESKFGEENSYIVLHDILPICDILNVPTITREIIEFYIQPDGSFRCPYQLPSTTEQIQEVKENPDSLPVPLVKHEVIRSIYTHRIFEELIAVI